MSDEARILVPPCAPFVELSFYFDREADEAAFAKLVGAIEGRGATRTGSGLAHTGDDAAKPFGGPSDFAQKDVQVAQTGRLSIPGVDQFRLVRLDLAGVVPSDPAHLSWL